MSRRGTPFIDQIRIIANESDYTLYERQRAFLKELARNPDSEDVWAAIEKGCGRQSLLTMRSFIRAVAGARYLAEDADQWPDLRAIIKKIEQFNGFLQSLKGSALYTVDGVDQAVDGLRHLARTLRKREERTWVHRRRQNTAKSRKRILFMQIMSMEMKGLFGRLLDHPVSELTNIFFPQADVTTDAVRAARRPSQRHRRAKAG